MINRNRNRLNKNNKTQKIKRTLRKPKKIVRNINSNSYPPFDIEKYNIIKQKTENIILNIEKLNIIKQKTPLNITRAPVKLFRQDEEEIEDIIGPTGPTGPTGANGIDGLPGDTGPIGPAGLIPFLSEGDIFIGDINNKPSIVTLEGDATLGSTGIITLSDTTVVPGSYTNSNLSVDSKGRITTIVSGSGAGLPSLMNNNLWIGNASNLATAVTISGDATLTNTGILTLTNTPILPGSYTLSSLTVDSKGRVTAASSNGTVTISQGGTNITSYTTGDLLYASATNVLSKLAIGSSSSVLTVTGGIPSWQPSGLPPLPNSNLWIGNGSNVATAVTISGDATMTNTGVLTLANTAVTPGSYTLSNVTIDSKGRITTASSNGTVTISQGGTNITSYTTGDLLYASATNVLSKLTIGSATDVLTVSGGIPSWQNTSLPSLTNGSVWIGNGSNIATPVTISGDATISNTGVLTLSNTGVIGGSYTLSNLTVDSKGRITAISNGSVTLSEGGTNITSYTTGDLLYASATNVLSKLSIGSATDVLTVSGGIPSWQNTSLPSLTNGNLWIGNGSNVATDVTISGDATVSNTGTLTLANTTVTPASYTLSNVTVDSKGRITAASNGGTVSATEGGTNITTYTTGDILYASAANTLSRLPIGNPGNDLRVNASALPSWESAVIFSGETATMTNTYNTFATPVDPTSGSFSTVPGGATWISATGSNLEWNILEDGYYTWRVTASVNGTSSNMHVYLNWNDGPQLGRVGIPCTSNIGIMHGSFYRNGVLERFGGRSWVDVVPASATTTTITIYVTQVFKLS